MLSALRTLFLLPIRSQCCFGCRRVLVLKLFENFSEVLQLGLTISAFFSISLTCKKTPQNRECQNHDRDTDFYYGYGWNLIRVISRDLVIRACKGMFLIFFSPRPIAAKKKLKKKRIFLVLGFLFFSSFSYYFFHCLSCSGASSSHNFQGSFSRGGLEPATR